MSQSLQKLTENGVRIPDFYFDVKTNIIYLIKSMAGKKIKISSGVKRPNVLEAKRKANAKLKIKLGAKNVRITPLIKDEIPLWLEVKTSERLSPGTMKNIEQAIKRIEGFWGSMFPHEITRDNIVKWFKWLEENYPGQQKEKPIKYLRNFARYLAEKSHHGQPLLPAIPRISNPDFREVKAARRKKKERIFAPAEFKAIYHAGNDTEKIVAMFMYTMAARIDETLNLRWGKEILLGDRLVYRWSIGQNKADLWGEHALHPRLIPLLAERLVVSETDLMFPQKFDKKKPLKPQMVKWADWRLRAGLDWHWTSHTFRHTCLSNLFNDEKNPQALICKLYRVSLAVAMDTYIHPTKQGIERMRQTLEVEI